LYYRIAVNFCDTPIIQSFRGFMARLGEVAVQVSYAYMSIIDEAHAKCLLIAKDSPHVMGTVAVGKVIAVGIGVDRFREGDRVVAFTLTGGGAQSILTVSTSNVVVYNAKEFDYLDVLIIATLSVKRKLLDIVKGANVLVVGNDLSIIPFAHVAQQYSLKVFTIPRYTSWSDIVKGEHISIYEDRQLFDVIVIASCDPLVISLVPRLAKDDAIMIVHPAVRNLLKFSDFNAKSITIKFIQFGDMVSGESIYTEFKDIIRSKTPLLNPQNFIAKPVFPAFIDLQNL